MESTLSCTLPVQCILTSTKTGLWSCDSCIMNGDKNYYNSTCSVNWAVQKQLQNLMMLPFLILFSSQLCIHPGMSWFLHLLSPSTYKKVTRIGQPYLLQIKIIGTLWNYDGDSNRNVKKGLNLISKTTSLHVHHAFLYILCCLCTTTMWNDQILSWLENGNCKCDKFYFLSLNSDAVPSLQFQPSFPPFK